MALFNKLFSTHKRKNVNTSPANQNAKQFPFSNEQVRILLYRECDWRGRRLLFDSTAVQKVATTKPPANGLQFSHIIAPVPPAPSDPKKHPSYIDTVDGIGYRYARPAEADFNDIGEMVFGSVAMSVRSTTLKVHWLPEPTRFLCSQVFVTPVPSGAAGNRGSAGSGRLRDPQVSDSMDTSSLNSFSLSVSVCVSDRLNQLDEESGGKSATNPLDVPNGAPAAAAATTSTSAGNLAYSDSGYGGTDPWTSSGSSYCPYNSSTRSSFGSVFSDRGAEASAAARKFSTDSAMTEGGGGAAAAATDGGGIQRRVQRNMSTSFENRRSMNDCVGFVGDLGGATTTVNGGGGGSHLSVGRGAAAGSGGGGGSEGCVTAPHRSGRRASDHVETHSNPEMIRRSRAGGVGAQVARSGKRAKLGLAICIQLSETAEAEMQRFCSEHIILLESMLCRLRATAETAYANQKRFYQLMLHAWFATAEWFVDLFTAPRLVEPVWLALSGGYAQDAKQLAQGFMQELCWLLNCADTKDTNFFISTLLTAILTHHLGWVGTVAALSGSSATSPIDSSTSTNNAPNPATERAKMSEISRFHPYNVLWAQMSDLYGAIGSPPKMSKTIVCGSEEPVIGKVLNVLTYFIRCGQIEREVRAEVFEKQVIDEILDEFVSCSVAAAAAAKSREQASLQRTGSQRAGGGMQRSATCMQGLSSVASADSEEPGSGSSLGRKNDIPNVLIFRDSRFVRQELRIGNFLMDTGIEMTGKQRQAIRDYQVKQAARPTVLVTSPTLEEFRSDDATSCTGTDDTVEEATERLRVEPGYSSLYAEQPEVSMQRLHQSPSLSDLITANSMGGGGGTEFQHGPRVTAAAAGAGAFLWGVEPIKEGVSEEQWQHIEKGNAENLRNGNCFSDGHGADRASTVTGNTVIELKRSKSLFTKSTNAKNLDRIRRSKSRKNIAQAAAGEVEGDYGEAREERDEAYDCDREEPKLKSYPSLSDLITANSCGASERLTWGIEPVKESVTLDEVHHFESSQRRIDDNNSLRNGGSGVVFVLGGDNETLANLKPRKTVEAAPSMAAKLPAAASAKKTCSHKKHSGVKFNFEKYPQIATNYMKNKNIDLAHYDFGADKSAKLDGVARASSSTATVAPDFPVAARGAGDSDGDSEDEECECCAGNATRTLLQTPSNATELEFNNDDSQYPTSTQASKQEVTVAAAAAVASGSGSSVAVAVAGGKQPVHRVSVASSGNSTTTTGSSSLSSAVAEAAAANSIKLITLPMSRYEMKRDGQRVAGVTTGRTSGGSREEPGGKGQQQQQQQQAVVRPAGFIPSLFVGITDHYVADMVLQGTTAPVSAWENNLKQNLSLSAHCATLEPRVTENVAILANTDQWDVKVVSSQTYVLPCGSGTSGPIGMSQLVASMLETVNAMWSAGLPAYQCMSFLESKLQELYLQSETLAAFLLATEFCSLSTVTSALNLSANDVPLLLSVASVHSPQVTKKYGVSFR